MTRKTTRKGIGYIRVSRKGDRGGDSYITEDDQRDRIAATAALHGIEIVEWISDINESGKKWNRPGFQRALALIETKQASALVVARMSRFGRNVLHVHRGIELIEDAGGQLVAGDLNVDTSTPQGRLMRNMLAAFAAFELEVATEHWVESKTRAVARGVKIGGRAGAAPVGYVWKENGERRLEPDPKTAHLIPQLFKRRAGGASWTELADWWHGETRRWFHRQTLQHLVRNRTYLGEVRYGKGEDALVNKQAHPPLVTPEVFEAAQSAHAPRTRNDGPGQLLTGLLICAGCGLPMTTTKTSSGKPGYRCRGLTTQGRCPAPQSVLCELADPVVEQAFLEWARAAVEGDPAGEEQIAEAVAAVEAARGEHVAYTRVMSASRYPELMQTGLEEREQAIEAAEAHLEQVRSSRRVAGLRVTVQEAWPTLDTAERRKLLAAGIERVLVKGVPEGSLARGYANSHALTPRRTARGVPFAARAEIVFRAQR